ncbi:ribbon-helix-helix protein, CopG family [Sesbania bispinosa]|nr:ribbon-helix-helix protein, CopG family [Sesbania bispinosa]
MCGVQDPPSKASDDTLFPFPALHVNPFKFSPSSASSLQLRLWGLAGTVSFSGDQGPTERDIFRLLFNGVNAVSNLSHSHAGDSCDPSEITFLPFEE